MKSFHLLILEVLAFLLLFEVGLIFFLRRFWDMAEYITLTGEIKKETDLAILFFDGSREVWLPKSQIEDQSKYSDGVEITIPAWLAKDKDLV